VPTLPQLSVSPICGKQDDAILSEGGCVFCRGFICFCGAVGNTISESAGRSAGGCAQGIFPSSIVRTFLNVTRTRMPRDSVSCSDYSLRVPLVCANIVDGCLTRALVILPSSGNIRRRLMFTRTDRSSLPMAVNYNALPRLTEVQMSGSNPSQTPAIIMQFFHGFPWSFLVNYVIVPEVGYIPPEQQSVLFCYAT
jgi:hypothetical protein